MISTTEQVNNILRDRGKTFLTCLAADADTVTLLDTNYGEYRIAAHELHELPHHKRRRQADSLSAVRQKCSKFDLKTFKIVDLFFARDRGFKNLGMFVEVSDECGHLSIYSYTEFYRKRKSLACRVCSKSSSPLVKRSSTYKVWLKHKDVLPALYNDFAVFRREMGDAPYRRSALTVGEKVEWVDKDAGEVADVLLISSALRQAFRHSVIYKRCLDAARVETAKGTKYRCAMCSGLTSRKNVHVDHIDPVVRLSGEKLSMGVLLERIWTDKVQVLDRKCHMKKTAAENKLRKRARSPCSKT